MTTNQELLAEFSSVFMPNYRPAPIAIDRGEGAYLFDVEGNRYLDFVAGIAVSALGHGHPALVAAIEAQSRKVLHVSNLYLNEPSIRLGKRLVSAFPGARVFFSSSGAEANEAALKLARRFHHDRGERERRQIISFEGSFHGRTYGALAATAQPKYHEGFEPMPEGFVYSKLGDVDALAAKVGAQTAAILVEPIQGEGGVRVAPDGFLKACRELADRAGALLVFDEVQTGIGRTGRLFAHEHEGVRPDILTLAKGLGGGLPIGAVLAREAVAMSLVYGTHGTTFGGNPLAATAGLVVLEHVDRPEVYERVAQLGAELQEGLRRISSETGVFSDVRGRGLLIGAELSPAVVFGAKEVVEAARAFGLLVHLAGPRVVRLAPPLILERSSIPEALDALRSAIQRLMGTAPAAA
ncbi:MAG: acetylornithine transaminase [Deltaproteobacteria bacterium]|nr:acetylornithine transaminase [Deltaproteobacteria bacterium]